MKRLFIVASMAIMVVGCQKTTIENEVLTPIGFNTELGKQTRAIIDGKTYTGTFGVYAYGHQGTTQSTVMGTDTGAAIEIAKSNEDQKWRANDGKTYYWPNDSETYINFYAYSPYCADIAPSMAEFKTEPATPATMKLTDYEHKKYQGDEAIDFMTADPATNQKYSTNSGVVDVVFNHQMTQVQFVVKKNLTNDNVTFKLVSITLINVVNKADYTNNFTTKYGSWTKDAIGSYTLFNNAEGVAIDAAGTNTTTSAATMIPQELVASATAPVGSNGSYFEVVYKISGTGVAAETVTKKIDLKAGSVTAWDPNRKIIYNLTVGLNEITFEPSVIAWDDDLVAEDPENDGPISSGDISIN